MHLNGHAATQHYGSPLSRRGRASCHVLPKQAAVSRLEQFGRRHVGYHRALVHGHQRPTGAATHAQEGIEQNALSGLGRRCRWRSPGARSSIIDYRFRPGASRLTVFLLNSLGHLHVPFTSPGPESGAHVFGDSPPSGRGCRFGGQLRALRYEPGVAVESPVPMVLALAARPVHRVVILDRALEPARHYAFACGDCAINMCRLEWRPR